MALARGGEPGHEGRLPRDTSFVNGVRSVRHLVLWAADTDHLIDDMLAVDVLLKPVIEAMSHCEGVVWASHDLDRESVCFSLMVESWARGSDDGLPEARLRARSCLRRCLADAGLIEARRQSGKVLNPPLRLRLDATPLALHGVQAQAPIAEGLN